ncbi:unnamed protein product [Clavelina lepadiformis]|uniref:Uncharacterized protein n=1 Tax=Clavelina lepadiformis TaxID=159417 RepID=A0ABP0G5E2_CLALP
MFTKTTVLTSMTENTDDNVSIPKVLKFVLLLVGCIFLFIFGAFAVDSTLVSFVVGCLLTHFSLKINKTKVPQKKDNNVTDAVIGQAGGFIKCGCFTLQFARDSLEKETSIRLQTLSGEDINYDGKKYFAISKVLICEPAGLSLSKPCIVTADTCYRPKSENLNVLLKVFNRKNRRENSWQELTADSTCLLQKSGRFTFEIDSLSDYVAQPATVQAFFLEKFLISYGFENQLSDNERCLTWYLFDGDEAIERIKAIRDGKLIIPYEAFCVGLGRDFYLRLRCNDVTINRKQVLIRAAQVRSIDVAISNRFLITKTASDVKSATVHYSVTQNGASRSSNKNGEALFGRFYLVCD